MTSAPPPVPPSSPPVDPPAWAPPPPPPGPPARPQLRRSRNDKILGGVSGGLAEYTGIDALLWRVGFVALALAGGTGVIVYLLLWLLMPAGPAWGPEAGTALSPATAPTVRRPAEPRSPVGRLTFAALLIVVGGLAVIDRFTWFDVEPRGFLGAALLVVGLGLVAAAFVRGRTGRGGLIAAGLVLSLALVVASAEPWEHAAGGVGDRTIVPGDADAVSAVYEGGLGDMTLDLTRVDVSDLRDPVVTRINHGVGDLHVLLPRDADARISVNTGLGSVDVLGQGSPSDGFFAGTGSGSWVDDDEAEIDLTINSGLGDVEVSRG